MTDKPCPDKRMLEQFLLGHVAADEAVYFEEHLSGCDSCLERAGLMSSEDELVAAMKEKRLPDSGGFNASEFIEQLQNEQAEVETSRIAGMQTGTVAGERDSMPNLTDLLDPSEQPEELGLIGQYRVLDVLGAGGMGVVLRAEDPHLKRTVAIKVIKGNAAADESVKSRFIREAQATAAIEHDNIVTIYQVSEHRGAPYYAMQFLRGETLEDRLKRERHLRQQEVLRIGREIAEGLAAAHTQGLLHRDIKPDNIWLEEKTDRVKIVDFGLARDTRDDDNLTMSGMLLGTPRYMSPEQAQGKPADHRGDLFSLGTVMYHLVTGKLPFEADNIASVLMAVIEKTPQPILEIQPGTDNELVNLIIQLMAKSPDSRFQSAQEVVDAIRNIEKRLARLHEHDEEQLQTRKTIDQLQQHQKRRHVLIGTATATVMLMVAVLMVFLFHTPSGTVRIDISDDDLEVLVDGERITLVDNKWKGEKAVRKHHLAIKLGDQTLKINSPVTFELEGIKREQHLFVQLNGVDLSSDEFTVSRGDVNVLTISYEERIAEPMEHAVVQPGESDAIELNGTITPEDGWVDILPAIDLSRDAKGSWKQEVGEVVGWGTLILPVRPAGSFECEVEFTHSVTGDGWLHFWAPHPHGRVGARLVGEAGLVVLKPADSAEETRILAPAPAVTRGEWHTLRVSYDIRADKTSISMTLDGRAWAEWTGDSQALRSRGSNLPHPIVSLGRQPIMIRQLRLRMLEGNALSDARPMPKQLDDLATAKWTPLFTSADELTMKGATSDRVTWKDGVIDVVNATKKTSSTSGLVRALTAPRGRNVIFRAEMNHAEGHRASLKLIGSTDDVMISSTKNDGYVLVRQDIPHKHCTTWISVPSSFKSRRYKYRDVAIALVDGHVGVYVSGKLILHRYGWNDEERLPCIEAFDIGYRPGRALFRNVRIMVLDEEPIADVHDTTE